MNERAVEVTDEDRDLVSELSRLIINMARRERFSFEEAEEAVAKFRIAALAAARPFHMEEAAGRALAEKVDADETGDATDVAYNRACDDCAQAIRTAAKTDGAAHDR